MKEYAMKLVVATIRPESLAAVQRALNKRGFDNLIVTHGFGNGPERSVRYIYRSTIIEERWLPRVKAEVVVEDDAVAIAVLAIRQAAATGHRGDGAICVVPLEEVIPVSPGDEPAWLANGN
jgi:nitrogen regulatory protein P-II 1